MKKNAVHPQSDQARCKDLIAEIQQIKESMHLVQGFKLDEFQQVGAPIIGLVEAGQYKTAVQQLDGLVKIGRGKLAGFIAHSVLAFHDRRGVYRDSFFDHEINERVEDGLEKDLVDRLHRLKSNLIQALNEERGPVFTVRIQAYSALYTALGEVVRIQAERIANRKAKAEQARREELAAKEAQKLQQQLEQAERNRIQQQKQNAEIADMLKLALQ